MLVIVGFCFNFLKATLSDWGAIFLIKHLDFTVQEANNAHFMFAIGGAVLLSLFLAENLSSDFPSSWERDSVARSRVMSKADAIL